MADQPRKPRKLKDLKARLGRTITPGQEHAGALPTPGANPAARPPLAGNRAVPGAIPPPVASPANAGVLPPPALGGQANVGAPGSIIPGLAGTPFGGAPSRPPAAADPFSAAQPAAGPREVRLVVDDQPVEDAEVGRKKRGRVLVLLGVGAALGLLIGGIAGSMRSDRTLFNMAVRDGKDIYKIVREASEKVTASQGHVKKALEAARGGAGASPSVDFASIEALRALEKPIDAGAFARKRYRAFKPETVDSLFEYYNNVNLLWNQFTRLANRTLPEARRKALATAVDAMGTVATPTGCVLTEKEGRWTCGLVFVAPNEGGEEGSVLVRTRRQAIRGFEKSVFVGATEGFVESPGEQVILIDSERSIGVLGEQANEFAEYTKQLGETQALLERTVEVQGRLEVELGEIAKLEEIFVL